MKRLVIAVLILSIATGLSGADPWGEHYTKGLAAVEGQDWPTVKTEMLAAIALKPAAQQRARWKNQNLTYLPYFYLGIALFEEGDIDGALAAFKASEEQGVIQNTQYLRDQRRFVAKAQAEKSKIAQEAASDTRDLADSAIQNATFTQAGAQAVGADRTPEFSKAKRLLQEAVKMYDTAGTDKEAFRRAAAKADEAKALFESAQNAARASRPTRPTPPPPPTLDPEQQRLEEERRKELGELQDLLTPQLESLRDRLATAEENFPDESDFQTWVLNSRAKLEQWETMVQVSEDPAELQPITQSITATDDELAQQLAAIRAARAAAAAPAPVVPEQPPASEEIRTRLKSDLTRAWVAFVSGDVDGCERIANEIVEGHFGSGDAYILRGIARYTKAMTLDQEELLENAAADFAVALRLNSKAKIDKRHFSPKLIAFFDRVKGSMRAQ